MASLQLSKPIRADVATVFAVFSDLAGAAERVRGIQKLEVLTEGSVGAGTRFRETRIFFKKEATEELEISVYQPGERMVVTCDSCGCHYETEYRFRPTDEGTLVELEMTTTPRTFLAKLMQPVGKLMAGAMRRCMEEDLADLATAAEARAPIAGVPQSPTLSAPLPGNS
jgi:hypothetical protein